MALIYDVSFDSQTRILSLLDKAGNVISSCEVPSKSNELTLTATTDNSSVKLKKNGTLSNTYEVNMGSGWTAYEFGTSIPLNAGQSCKWRCSAHPTAQTFLNYIKFVMTGTIEASGNCNSMLSSDFENLTSLSGYDYAFYNLFKDCTALTQAPELPATTLAEYCYQSMFQGCTSLVQAPSLPATSLVASCYYRMFQGCTSLTQAPVLPATTLANTCYMNMFNGCSNLSEIRTYATKPTADSGFGSVYNWVQGVSATGDFYCNPNTTWTTGVSGIPQNWVRHDIADYPQT